MKICYFDAFSGISGDMTVGALLDAGASFEALKGALDSLGTGASVRVEKTKRKGIAASKFHVEATDSKAHRHLHHVEKMINDAALPEEVKETSLRVFRKLAESEARMHATTLEKVHFHEVGAVDSICDIVGATFCLHDLKIEQVASSAINVGSGTVKTEHGILPVPAPATADLLSGKLIYSRGPELELTTPTGAAFLAALAPHCGPMPPMRIEKTGYGAGDRDFPENANVLRATIGHTSGARESTTVSVIEANIDDSPPQVLGFAMERLLEAGALDVTLTPVHMKKNRPGTVLTIISSPELQETLVQELMRETSTLGVRAYTAERRVQQRDTKEIDTPNGRVRIKTAQDGSFSPEYDDCRKLAIERNLPLKQIIADANFAYRTSQR